MDTGAELVRHPALTVGLITLLFGLVITLGKIALSAYEKRVDEKFNSLARHNVSQDTNLENLKADFYRTGNDIHSKTKELKIIHDTVSEINDEVKSLVRSVSEFQLVNEKAHSGLIVAQERLMSRIEAVEKKMPNGELKRLASAFEKLADGTKE